MEGEGGRERGGRGRETRVGRGMEGEGGRERERWEREGDKGR